jgi:murein DD-endopeptidase MepM/ murein hydrolase activator NlpD
MRKSKFLLIFVSICILGLFLYLLASKAARNSVKGVDVIEFVKPVKKGFVASSFGWRKNPFTGEKEFHKGIDIAAQKGTDVYAAAEGTVVSAVSDYVPDSVPGKHVLIMHSKKIKTFYSKLDSVLVKEGQTVKAGELIGKIGTSGVSKGPHLHFEVLVDDVAQNPAKYIGSKR